MTIRGNAPDRTFMDWLANDLASRLREFGFQIKHRREAMDMSINEASNQALMSWTRWKLIEDGHCPNFLPVSRAAKVVGMVLLLDLEEE